MTQLLFVLPTVEPGDSVRVDTTSGSNTPATVYAARGGAVVGPTFHADPAGALPHIYGADGVRTLYLKHLNYKGTVTGSPVTLTGVDDSVSASGGSGASAASLVLSDRGAWATATAYVVGDRTVQGGVNYLCIVAHTSGTFATDLGAGKWEEVGVNSTSAATLSNATPQGVGRTGSAGSATTALRADAVIPSMGTLSFLWGDASDGSLILDGTVAAPSGMTKSGSVYTMSRDFFLDTLTVNSGVTLKPNGFRMYVANTLTNNGTIAYDGNNAVGATAGAVGSHGSIMGGGAGGNGGAGNGSAGGNSPGATPSFINGGLGGAGSSGTGGAVGANGTQFSNGATFLKVPQQGFTGIIPPNQYFASLTRLSGSAGGGGGGGDGTNSGGGGGAGGGVVLINARIVNNTASGVISAKGGNGAAGVAGNTGGGGGGVGGVILINTTSYTNNGSVTVASGTGGAGAGTGSAGASPANGPTIFVNTYA